MTDVADGDATPDLPPATEAAHPRRRWIFVGAIAVVVIAGGVVLVLVLTHKTSTVQATAPSQPPPTGPALASLIPPNYVVTKEATVRLSSTAPPLVVVTDTETTSTNSDGLLASDLLLLSWDGYVHRWVTVFDGAKTPGPDQTDILPADWSVSDLRYQTITPTLGRTDLAFSAQESAGANGDLAVGIIHYNGQVATLAYEAVIIEGASSIAASAAVKGTAPHQTFNISAPWLTQVDAMSSPVRSYQQVIGWVTSPQGGANYEVVTDTRSWLGAYAVSDPGVTPIGPTTPLVVIATVPGSPAAGVLKPGDELLSVQGVTVPGESNLLGPAVIDELASQQPGARVALSIVRDGQQMVVNMTLSSEASASFQSATAPIPGYLGVGAETDSSAVASEYGLGTATGAVVGQVVSGGPADSAGLQDDDVITSVNSTQVTSVDSLLLALDEAGAYSPASITYVDSTGASNTISVTLGAWPTTGNYLAPTVYGF